MLEIMRWISKNTRWLSIVILLIPIVCYVFQFCNAGISNDPEKWAQFGDYVGGVYSVLVTIVAIYLARSLALKDEVANKRREAIDEIFQQISKIEQCKENRSKTLAVNKLLRLVLLHKLHISEEICRDVQRLADYYLGRITGTDEMNIYLEDGIKDKLKKAYYGS